MKLAFDAKRALNNFTGLGNHARILLNAMMRDFPEHEYLLLTPKINDGLFNELTGDFEMQTPETKFQKAFPALWRSFGISKQMADSRVDLYHGLSNELPLNIHNTGIKTVVTIHDLIFLKHKEQYPWIDRQVYEYKTKYATKHADKIIAVSNETKNDLMEMYGVPGDKIEVVYQSVDSLFWTTDDRRPTTVKQTYNLPEKFILNVGSFFPRKNQERLIEAFDLIKDKVEESLLLAGSTGNTRRTVEELIERKKLSNRVKIISGVTNEDMPALYKAANVFVFPSLMEGFGMPVLEALISKVPVIATKGGAIEEAGGKGSLYINPTNAGEMANAILKVLSNEALRNQMIEAGTAHALTMTDKLFAEKTMKVYEEVLNRP